MGASVVEWIAANEYADNNEDICKIDSVLPASSAGIPEAIDTESGRQSPAAR